MKRLFVFACVCSLVSAMASAAGEDGTTYGDGISLKRAVTIETLLANPDGYVGKNVRVDGVITGVCKKRGCWMQVTDPDTGKGIRIKVEDGVIVFPYTSMGHRASAEGVFDASKLTAEQVAAMKAHQEQSPSGEQAASEKGCERAKADSASNAPGCAPEVVDDTVYLIRGTGAVIHG